MEARKPARSLLHLGRQVIIMAWTKVVTMEKVKIGYILDMSEDRTNRIDPIRLSQGPMGLGQHRLKPRPQSSLLVFVMAFRGQTSSLAMYPASFLFERLRNKQNETVS